MAHFGGLAEARNVAHRGQSENGWAFMLGLPFGSWRATRVEWSSGKTTRMKPRIHVITLAVDDLERSRRFYQDGLGLGSGRILGSEFLGDEKNAAGAVVLFVLERSLMLCLYPRSELAKDANVPISAAKPGAFSIGHAVATREEVDAVLALAKAAGATLTDQAHERPWGIYSGYFQDPDGHLWEVIWNPALRDV
jgi:catechol 2,3-dioxygenase-like lactoylglutathione lyase family enzyme